MSAEFVNNLDNDTEASSDKKKKSNSARILRVADAAIEKESERPRSIFYGLEDENKKQPESVFSIGSDKENEAPKPILPSAEEIIRQSKENNDENENDEEEDEEVIEEKGRITDEEKPEVIEKIGAIEAEQLPQPDPEAEKPQVAEDQAAEVFYENLQEKKDIEAAVAATYREIGANEAEVEAAKPAPETAEPIEADTTDAEQIDAAPVEPREFGEEESEVNLREVHAAGQEAEDIEETAEADDSAVAGAGGRGTVPPQVLAGGGPNGPGGAGGPNQNREPGFARFATSGNLNEQQGHVPEYDQGNPAVTALIGALIGYRFGKRRGRRMEQRKLIPVQKRLEREVNDLHWQVKQQETQIRRVAREKALREGDAFLENLRVAHERYVEKSERRQMRKMEVTDAPRRQRAPEARQLHGARHERIGHVLMAAEAETAPIAAKRTETPRVSEALGDRRVETLNRAELMRLSERIVVDGTTLRQIYESKLIGERGLRRLLAEHLRGGDIKKVLRQEIIEREIDFERDPVLRDQPALSGSTGGNGGTAAAPKANKTQLNRMLAKAGASLPDSDEEAAFYKARAAYEAAEREQQQRHKQMMDSAFVAIIIILLGVVVLLAVR